VKLKLCNAVLFQLTWFACVLGGARGEWLWGVLGVAALMLFSACQTTLGRDLKFVAVLVVVGLCLDSLWATTGVLDFGAEARAIEFDGFVLRVAPIWILMLWAGVGLTLLHSLAVFASRPWLGAIMAGGASIPSYLAGQRLGGVIIPEPLALGIIVSVWALLFFVMFNWARRHLVADSLVDDRQSEAGYGDADHQPAASGHKSV